MNGRPSRSVAGIAMLLAAGLSAGQLAGCRAGKKSPSDDSTLPNDAVESRAAQRSSPEQAAVDAAARALASAMISGPIRSRDNPFSNTCNGKSIGFVGPTGERPRMEFTGIPRGAVLECRSAPEAEINGAPFRKCDGADGTQPFHLPELKTEGTHRTEMKYVAAGKTSATQSFTYYVHHSLDKVNCCTATRPDSAWFRAARAHIRATEVFDSATHLENPFISIIGGQQREKLLSLRRTFKLSPDRRLLLIRRTMCSRRTLAKDGKESCVGLTISVPNLGIDPADWPPCPKEKEKPYKGKGAYLDYNCPSIYCTVTSCRRRSNGCMQVTHTFNRGPQQSPWIVRQPEVCPKQSTLTFTDYHCEAYVLNHDGHGVCLVNDKGTIRAVTTIDREALGLALLRPQRNAAQSGDRYVFSAKATKPSKDSEVVYLPR
jgi:hypothetical protein